MSMKAHCDICDKAMEPFKFIEIEHKFNSIFNLSFPHTMQVCDSCFIKVKKYIVTLQKASSMEV